MNRRTRMLPFLRWLPLQRQSLCTHDVAIILIPQSMSYAQVTSMPAYYGLQRLSAR